MTGGTLSLRALNRATLARQQLLHRHAGSPVAVVERLVALQAQLPRPPFVGLWSRVESLTRQQLVDLVGQRTLVRGTMMRGTLHLLSAADYQRFRATIQPVLDAGMTGILGARVESFDRDRLLAEARAILAGCPRPFDDLRRLLRERFPDGDERAMGYAVRMLLPLLQLPSEGERWAWHGKAPFGLAEQWLGAPPEADGDPAALVRRYLAAFGPATPADATAWSGLRGMRALFDQLRPELVVLRDAQGRELFDLPDAPRPPEDAPAPVRFLPEWDNLLLSHADRTRVLPEPYRAHVFGTANGMVYSTVLVDGMVAGRWATGTKRGVATLTVTLFGRSTRKLRTEIEREGAALLAFAEEDAREQVVAFDGA